MNQLTDINYIKGLLKSYGFKPNEILGQNFLIDEEVLTDLIKAADLTKADTVLEVGPGLGVLTRELVKKVGRVVAVEKDKRLLEILNYELRITDSNSQFAIRNNQINNLTIVSQDILKFNISEHIKEDYKVVANIPYYLTSKLIQNLLEAEHQPSLMILMLQKEVGERIVAFPGELSILAISVQVYADVEIVQSKIPARRLQPIPDLSTEKNKSNGQDPGSNQGDVRDGFEEKQNLLVIHKTSFWPEPKVDSVIIRIEPREKYPDIRDHKLFFRIVKSAFAGKRKQIHNTLSAGLKIPPKEIAKILSDAKIPATARPQELSIEQWISLYQRLL